MEKLPNANYIIRDYFKDKENLQILNKALSNGFWENLSETNRKDIVIEKSAIETDDKDYAYLKIKPTRSKMWMLARAKKATDNPEILGYELKFQLDRQDVMKSVGLLDDPVFTKYAVVVLGSDVRIAQVINEISFDPTPFLEKLKAEVAKS